VVFAADDPVAPARLIRDVARSWRAEGQGCVARRDALPARSSSSAGLPTKHELRAQVVGVLEAPSTNWCWGSMG